MSTEKNEELLFSDSEKKNKNGESILGTLEGPCADIINPTRNGRRYSEELWEKVFNGPIVKELFNCGGILGELDHPVDRTELDTSKVAICMPEPPVKKDGKLWGKWHILDTPNGRIAATLAKYGYKLGISSRGSGDVETDYDGNESVNPDTYEFTCFDLVIVPAVKAARLSFTESLNNTKSLSQALTESLNNASDDDRRIMQESLQHLGISINESAYTKDELIDKFGTDDLDIINAGNEETVTLKESNILDKATPYMLRNDGELIKCDSVHPYIKYVYENSNKRELEELFHSHLDALNWFYENTRNNDLKESLKSLVYSVVNSNIFSINKEKIINTITFDYNSTEQYSDNEEEINSIFINTNDLANQEFCRVRTSNMRFGGNSNDIYFRISSVGFNWFDLIYKLVSNNSKYISTVSICKDTQTFGGKVDFYYHKGIEINKLPVDEFLTLSGNPIIESYKFKSEICDLAMKDLINGKSVNEAFADLHPRYVNGNMVCLKEAYLKTVFNSVLNENVQYKNHVLVFTQSGCIVRDSKGKFVQEFENESAAREYIDSLNENLDSQQEGSKPLDDIDIEDEVDSEVDNNESLIEQLQQLLIKNNQLNSTIIDLQEKLSVCYAKENKLNEEASNYKKSITKLIEKNTKYSALEEKLKSVTKELNSKLTENKSLLEQINSLKSRNNESLKDKELLKESMLKKNSQVGLLTRQIDELNEALSDSKNENKVLNEKIETINKDLKLKNNEFLNKLKSSNNLVEKYKKIAKGAVDRYISSQADKLGLSVNEIKNRLPESYTFNDIDSICENLQTYKVSMSRLPFGSSKRLTESTNFSMQVNPSSSEKNFNKMKSNSDDAIDEQLEYLAKL